MTTIILLLTIIISIVGLFLATQTIVETRKKYFNEYLERKRKRKNITDNKNNIKIDNSNKNKI